MKNVSCVLFLNYSHYEFQLLSYLSSSESQLFIYPEKFSFYYKISTSTILKFISTNKQFEANAIP